MKALILGGAGFLGKNLTRALQSTPHRIRVFDRPGSRPEQPMPGVEWREGDFGNGQDLAAAVNGCELVFHLISTTLPGDSNRNPVRDIETNVLPSIRLLEIAREAKVRKIIFISSGGVIYGIPRQIPIPEDHPTNPICSYGIGKLAIEKYLALFHANGGPDYAILRLSNPFGQFQSAHATQGAVAVFSEKIRRGETIDIWGDGSVIRDYIYIQDVMDAILKSIDYRGKEKIFNIGSNTGVSVNQLLDTLEEVLGRKARRRYLQARNCDVPVNVLDNRKAIGALQWQPRFTLKTGLTQLYGAGWQTSGPSRS